MHSYANVILIVVLTAVPFNAVESAISSKNANSEADDHHGQYESADAGLGGPQTVRERRDVYGSGGGGYGTYSGGGSYGCYCPYQQCDINSDMLLYFSAGVLLGLLFTMLQPTMMMMAATTGRQQSSDDAAMPGFTLANLPNIINKDIAPLVLDMMSVYSRSSKMPDCARRWLCEVTQQSLKKGGLRARLGSLSSVAVSWFMKDMMPFVENLTGNRNVKGFDCALLGLTCGSFLDSDSEATSSST